MLANHSKPTVAVVLCTFNGAQHLSAQLESLSKQSWPISILAFDDGSEDNTIEVLESFQSKLSINITRNPDNLGYVGNFEQGIAQALASGYRYIALCDQDDVWQPQRIDTGMQELLSTEATDVSLPILTHCDLCMVDSAGNTVHESFFAYRQYSIGKEKAVPVVLGQNGVMGNTILMNGALAEMALPFPPNLHVHDYWLATLVELYGTRILLDDTLVNYRIHDGNASNSQDEIKFGIQKQIENKSWGGFVSRDYRLPFKEDARLDVINTIMASVNRLPDPTTEQRKQLSIFRDYLEFKKPRYQLLYKMLRAGFFRKGLKHRARIAFSTLFTARYKQTR